MAFDRNKGIEKINEEDERAKMLFDLNEKRSWVGSFRLWTTPIEYENQEYFSSGRGGAFVPFKKGSTSTEATTVEDNLAEVEDHEAEDNLFGAEQQKKKQRRTWSPQLHTMFIDAVNVLGGVEDATPKKILEKMRMEGLTSDEVKSHLQKYRIHVRKHTNISSVGPANKEVSGNDGYNNMQDKKVFMFKSQRKQADG